MIILSSLPPLFPPIYYIFLFEYFRKLAGCCCNHPLFSALLGFTSNIYLVLLHAGLPARSTVVNFLFKIVFLSVEEKTTGMLGWKLFGESPVNIHILNKKVLQLLISVYCLTVCTRREKVIGMCSLLLIGLYIYKWKICFRAFRAPSLYSCERMRNALWALLSFCSPTSMDNPRGWIRKDVGLSITERDDL